MVVVVRKAPGDWKVCVRWSFGIHVTRILPRGARQNLGQQRGACSVVIRNNSPFTRYLLDVFAIYSQYFPVDLLVSFLLMSHVQKRLVTTAAKLTSLSATNLTKFPPKQALIVKSDVPQPTFDPEIWASLQPPPPPALSAFAHRIGLASILTSTDLIQRACTHPSFTALYSQHYPREAPPSTNAQLVILGNSLLGLFATEYLNAKYPYLPTRVQKAALTAHVGPATCASIAQEMGAAPLVRWHRTVRFSLARDILTLMNIAQPRTPTRPSVLHTDALASVPRALTALVYQQRSLFSARKFVHSYFLSRQIDLRGMLKFLDPKKALLEMVKKFDREKPKSRYASQQSIADVVVDLCARLLKETGRFSNSPVFVVGIFSGADQLGEGFGSSLKMAEFRVRLFMLPLWLLSEPFVRPQKMLFIAYILHKHRTISFNYQRRPSLVAWETSFTTIRLTRKTIIRPQT